MQGGVSSILGMGTKIPHAEECSKKKKKNIYIYIYIYIHTHTYSKATRYL